MGCSTTEKNRGKNNHKRSESDIDEAGCGSFPASDPPSWMPGIVSEIDDKALRRKMKKPPAK